jgi:hypothetical protein
VNKSVQKIFVRSKPSNAEYIYKAEDLNMEGPNINTRSVPDRVVRMELISFFTKHPQTIDSPQYLAERLGRHERQIKHQMDELVHLGILRKTLEGGDDFYAYIPAVSAPLSKKKAIIGEERRQTTAKREVVKATPPQGRKVQGQMRLEGGETFEDDVLDANGLV